MGKVSTTFFKGLAAVLPVVVTAYLLYWMASRAESLLGTLIKTILPARWYVPGMGMAAGVVLVLVVGLLLNAYLVRKVWSFAEGLLQRIPLVKTIYGAAQDLLSFFSQSERKDMHQVVLVPLSNSGYRVLGFITRDDFSRLPEGFAETDTVSVYIPMSYQMGGYTVLAPRSALQTVDMSVEQAMRFAITAGLSTAGKESPRSAHPGVEQRGRD